MLIRSARVEDLPEIYLLIRELADFERAPHLAQATEQQLRASFFGDQPHVFCEMVESEQDEIAGCAIWFVNYSTWTGTHGVHLEDLFIRESFRGRGYATAVLRHLAKVCVDNGYHRFQWSVLDWNEPAISFYTSLGAEALDEWTTYRLSGDALQQLATSP